MALLLVPVAATAWLVATEAGLRAALQWIAWGSNGQVTAATASGRLAGEFRISAVRIESPDLRMRVDDIAVAWRPSALFDRHLDVGRLAVGRIELATRPSPDDAPGQLPSLPLELPLSLTIRDLLLGHMSVLAWDEEGDPLRVPLFQMDQLSARIATDRHALRVEHLNVVLPFGALDLQGTLGGGSAPGQLSFSGSLAGAHQERDYQVDFLIGGDLNDVQVRADASGSGLDGDLEIRLAPFERIPVRQLKIAVGEVDPSQFDPRAPSAALAIRAELHARSVESWVLEGPIEIENRLPASVDRGGIPIHRMAGNLRWTPEAASIDGLEVSLPGEGRLAGALDWQFATQQGSPGRLSAALEWSQVPTQLIDARLPAVLVSGRIDADGDEVQQSARFDLRAGQARIEAQAEFRVAQGVGEAARFAASGELVAFDPAIFMAGAPQADLNLHFDTEGVLDELFNARLEWRFGASSVEGRALGGKGRIVLAGERLADADVLVEVAGNRLSARGAWGQTRDVLAIRVDAPALSAVGYGLAGRAGLEGTLTGGRSEPAGQIQVFGEDLNLPGDVRIAALSGSGRVEAGLEGPVQVALAVSGVGGRGSDADRLERASLVVTGRRRDHAIEVEASTPDQDTLAMRLQGALLGEMGASNGGQGVSWKGRLMALDVVGRVAARLVAPAGLTVARDHVVLDTARFDAGERGRIELKETIWRPGLAVVRGELAGLVVEAAGPARQRRTGRGPGPLVMGAEWHLRLGPAVDGEIRVFRESGDVRVGTDLTTRVGLEHLEARLDAVSNRLALSLDVRGTQLGALSGAVTALAEPDPAGGWRLAPDAAMLGSARFDMPSIAWLARMVQEETVLGGALKGDFSFSGTPADPLAAGRITGTGLSIALVEHGLQLSGGELLAEFDRDRLRLTQLTFDSPNRIRPGNPRVPVEPFVRTPGRLDASGEIALESGQGKFEFAADRLPILQRPDRWLIVSGEGSATSTWTSLELSATLRADAGYVELADTPPPSLSDDVVIAGRELKSAGAGVKLAAQVTVSLGDELHLSALGLDTRLTGELRLALRDGQPLYAVGTIATVGGVYKGYGQFLTIDQGLINFQGVVDNPGLNVVALRKGLEVEAGIAVGGSARRPQIRLVSEPNVPDPEKLSWIVLGRAPTAGSGADLSLLLPAAQALLGGPGGGMTEQLSQSLGFDEFAIGQGSIGGAGRSRSSRVVGSGSTYEQGSVSGQVLTVGKRLSSDLFLSFEQSLGGAESLVRLSYQLSRRVSVVVRGGTDNAADIFYTVSFR